MSAIIEVACGQSLRRPVSAEESGHRFRGRMLNKYGLLENWAVRTLQESRVAFPHYFSLKIEAVRSLATSTQSPSRSADRVRSLLDCLKPYMEIRSVLAHSVMRVAKRADGEVLVMFELACESAGPGLQRRQVFTDAEMAASIAELGRIAGELSQLKIQR